MFTGNVPYWFADAVTAKDAIFGDAAEVIVSKLTENAYLATKVTFFHELARMCEAEGIDFEAVRQITTMDPRIGPDHSYVEQYGWQSHCFDKDIPAFAALGSELSLVQHALVANRRLLAARDTTSKLQRTTTQVV